MIVDRYPATEARTRASVLSMVYVVDDDEAMRDSLSGLLRSVGLDVEAYGTSGDFLAAARPSVPGCLILDVRLRGENGLEVQDAMARHQLHMPIVFITGYGDIPMTVRAMKAGAEDFLSKPFRDQDMLDAVGHALARDRERIQAEQSLASTRGCYESLTPREREVLGFVMAGLMNKQIASEMNVSEVTVKMHRGQVMKKMTARSVADLVRMAQTLGVQPPRKK
ncbi:response regulator transcription factor [Paraburkholderia sp. C35]|uniref:response regulator transcription factor n=1 Tax=Paraburkholderia sp. C35 TaxID=2126993 RepID=UPI000D692AD5|nr:response regulator transcription factor [Paraburkholderia sp. C35]